jgi:hypothetical protein
MGPFTEKLVAGPASANTARPCFAHPARVCDDYAPRTRSVTGLRTTHQLRTSVRCLVRGRPRAKKLSKNSSMVRSTWPRRPARFALRPAAVLKIVRSSHSSSLAGLVFIVIQ